MESRSPVAPPPTFAAHVGGGARTAYWEVPDSDGLKAKVLDVGRGVPVVFLHGLVGLNEHWEGVVERSRTKMRCVLFELPLLQLRGDQCSIQGATDVTARFLREYMNEPAVLVGNSFGGHIAAKLALAYPAQVRGLVLAGASGIIEKSMVSDIQIRPSREWLARKIGELFFDQSFMRSADLDRAYKELSDRGGARAMVKLSRSARKDHLGDSMRSITAPTLLIWGKQDVVTPPEAAAGFKKHIPHSKMVWFDRCGHAPMIEKPDEFAQAMLEFAVELESSNGRKA